MESPRTLDSAPPADSPGLSELRRAIAERDPASLPSFAELFSLVADERADEPAVRDDTTTLTYRELDARSAAIARALQAESADDDSAVAVLTGHDTAAIVAFLGVVRSGRPIVILDRVSPDARLTSVLELARPTELLADAAHRQTAERVATPGVRVRGLDELESAGSAAPAALRPVPADAVAAILFTSGSSGQPKGVVWDQRQLSAEALASGDRVGYEAGFRVAMSLPVGFAHGLTVLAMALAWGATLDMCDPRVLGAGPFMARVRERRISAMHGTPSMLRGLFRVLGEDDVLEDLRVVSAAGEALYSADIALVRRHTGGRTTFFQWFGSSETGSITFLRFDRADAVPDGAIPAGTAAAWRTIHIVDDGGRELPVGETGSVVVRSPLMARGYWGDPARTAERITERPDGLRDLRTGDVGALDDAGVLRLLGRSEAAVKIRGYLVDPSEIEAALLASGEVAETVVVPAPGDGPTQLVAYVAPVPGRRTPSPASLRSWVGSRLPAWMVPAHIVQLRELPKNERGKVDRPALPPPPPRVVEPPRTEFERSVARIWADVLRVEEVGLGDDFYGLGGDSLDAEEMLVRLAGDLGITLKTSDFTQATGFADFVRRAAGETLEIEPPRWPATRIEIRRGTSGRTIFCIAGADQTSVAFVPLAARMPGDDTVTVLQARGVERRAVAEWSVRGMVARRLASVRALQPSGPYVIIGHSLGAVLALEMARRLSGEGEQVRLVLLDPFFLTTRAVWPARPRDLYRILVAADEGGTGPWRRARRWGLAVTRLALVGAAGLLPASVESRHEAVFRRAALAVRLHRPVAWDGPTLAVKTAENQDPDEVWAQLAPSAVRFDVASDHTSLLRSPFIEPIAEAVRDFLADQDAEQDADQDAERDAPR